MFTKNLYLFLLLSVAGGLLNLLGSLGIFVSLIIQRRVERLQEILEELVDQSYIDDLNLTSKINQLINRYQMHYILPDNPSKIITWYVDLTIIIVTIFWLAAMILVISKPFNLTHIMLLVPLIVSIFMLVFFRKLLKNAINPLDNRLLNSIIPPPAKLRSVSFLSSYVNVSVKSLLKQARLTITVEKQKNCDKGNVILKEELSFDDFFYYFAIYNDKRCFFLAYANLILKFPPDPITLKPTPVQRNINIPLGQVNWHDLTDEVTASLLIFSRGEKHPIQYDFKLVKNDYFFVPKQDPNRFINQNITYKFNRESIEIIESNSQLPYLAAISKNFYINDKRFYLDIFKEKGISKRFKVCDDPITVR